MNINKINPEEKKFAEAVAYVAHMGANGYQNARRKVRAEMQPEITMDAASDAQTEAYALLHLRILEAQAKANNGYELTETDLVEGDRTARAIVQIQPAGNSADWIRLAFERGNGYEANPAAQKTLITYTSLLLEDLLNDHVNTVDLAPAAEYAVGTDVDFANSQRLARLHERRDGFNNNFGYGAFKDGLNQEQITKIDAEIAVLEQSMKDNMPENTHGDGSDVDFNDPANYASDNYDEYDEEDAGDLDFDDEDEDEEFDIGDEVDEEAAEAAQNRERLTELLKERDYVNNTGGSSEEIDRIDAEIATVERALMPKPKLVALHQVGELRRALVSGIVCLSDTDNEGEVRHQFVTQNRGLITNMHGKPMFMPESTRTVFVAYDLVLGGMSKIQPDHFTGTAYTVANLSVPEPGFIPVDGHLILDTLVGPLFTTRAPAELPMNAKLLSAVGGLTTDGRLGGIYPFTPIARQKRRETDNSNEMSL